MKVGLVAIHYPQAAYRAELISRIRAAAEVMRQTPGCLSVDYWTNPDNETVVTTGQWESEAAMAAAFAAVQAAQVDFDYDERELRPREVLRLVAG